MLLGTLLPDLIDKPVFLAIGLYHHFHDGGWTPGKRGVAHTALFLAVLALTALRGNSPRWCAVSVGTATHLLLDVVSKTTGSLHLNRDVLAVLFWPLLGWSFPALTYGMHGVAAIALEVVGAALLVVQLTVRRFKPSRT